MDRSKEEHLLRLHAYLQKNVTNKPGINVIKTGVLSHCQKEFLVPKIKQNDMCPSCFCYWTEGNFSLRFKSQKSKRKKIKLETWKIKCLNCGKHSSSTHHKPSVIKPRQLNMKKSKLSIHQSYPCPKGKKLEKLPQPCKSKNRTKNLPQAQKSKKERKNLPLKKKSNLTFFQDFVL